MNGQDPAETARAIIDGNLYMVLGTVDDRGRPWTSPVYYAPQRYRDFYWVSRPDALHSRNLAARPDVSIVIFDSSVPIGTGQGVYMTAVAAELTGTERDNCIRDFQARTGSRTEPAAPVARPRTPDSDKGGGSTMVR